jgi:large subunit ribosomal protein L3
MASGLIGQKLGMSQSYDKDGNFTTVTVIKVGPCFVSQIKTKEKDGYSAIQLAFESAKEKALSKPEIHHLSKKNNSPQNPNLKPMRHLKEFRDFSGEVALGSELAIDTIFQSGDTIKVTGTSKGKGYQGVVKRHGFSGGPQGHGSRFQRHPGSIGSNTTPGRVFKGMKMAGRGGSLTSTVRNLKVVKIIPSENIILVSGPVPGRTNGIVTLEKLK